jgi:CRP-like cAMP-binding protein
MRIVAHSELQVMCLHHRVASVLIERGAVQMIASQMRPMSATRGTHVVKQGSDADSIYFLQRGAIEVRNNGATWTRGMLLPVTALHAHALAQMQMRAGAHVHAVLSESTRRRSRCHRRCQQRRSLLPQHHASATGVSCSGALLPHVVAAWFCGDSGRPSCHRTTAVRAAQLCVPYHLGESCARAQVLHLGRTVSTLVAPVTFGEAALLQGEMDGAEQRLSGYRTVSTSMCAARARCNLVSPLHRTLLYDVPSGAGRGKTDR